MNYSPAWQEQLDYYNSLRQKYDWEYVVTEQKLNDPKNYKAENLIILNKPVWVEIHSMVGNKPFRKIKAVSKYNVYFDGVYEGMSHSLSLGCINGWDYTIDGHTLDLSSANRDDQNNQERLIDLIKTYSDGFYEPVPKGILKIPTII